MGNDMTWEQKCRISALRAACASPYDHPTGISDESTDDIVTKRILARAEAFRVALLNDGPLDDRYHGQEVLGPKYDMKFHRCVRCGAAIESDPVEKKKWIDGFGKTLCERDGILMHTPVEPIGSHCPGCGSNSHFVRKAVSSLSDHAHDGEGFCVHKWHQE